MVFDCPTVDAAILGTKFSFSRSYQADGNCLSKPFSTMMHDPSPIALKCVDWFLARKELKQSQRIGAELKGGAGFEKLVLAFKLN